MTWQWSLSARRYRDSETGQFLSRERALEFVQRSIEASGNVSNTLASMVGSDEPLISAADWREAMRREIKDEYIRQYLLGRGGRNVMTPADWGSTGGMIAEQYKHLEKFYQQVDAAELSEAQIRARAEMYIKSAREGYERGATRAQGVPELPAYPGDGSTVCLTNCQCNWRIETTADGWLCYWTLGAAEHCPDCTARASEWNPLFVEAV